MPHNQTDEKKILVLGGCHVEGFKVGELLSFVWVFNNKLIESGYQTNLSFKAYVIAKQIDKIVELIDLHSPELMVLQMGNYEFNPKISIKDYFTSRLTFKTLDYSAKNRKGSKNAPQSQVEGLSAPKEVVNQPDEIYSPPSGFVLSVKESLASFINHFDGHNRVNLKQINELYSKLFKILKERNLNVVVMSPLPIVNKVQQRYRLFGGKKFQKLANDFGFEYFDSSAALTKPGDYLPDHKLFIDMSHLNAEGHKILGTKLAEAVLPLLKKA